MHEPVAAALAGGLIVGGAGGFFDTSVMTQSEECNLRSQLSRTREEVLMLRTARDADFAALTTKVAELEAVRTELEAHSAALLQELRVSQEEQREQHSLQTTKSREASERMKKLMERESTANDAEKEAWADRVHALQEHLQEARLEVTSLKAARLDDEARFAGALLDTRRHYEEQRALDEQKVAAAQREVDEAKATIEALRRSKEGLQAMLSRSRAPPGAHNGDRDVAESAAAAELEREVLTLRAKLGRSDASGRAQVLRLSKEVAQMQSERDEYASARSLLEAAHAQQWGKKAQARSVSTETDSVSRWQQPPPAHKLAPTPDFVETAIKRERAAVASHTRENRQSELSHAASHGTLPPSRPRSSLPPSRPRASLSPQATGRSDVEERGRRYVGRGGASVNAAAVGICWAAGTAGSPSSAHGRGAGGAGGVKSARDHAPVSRQSPSATAPSSARSRRPASAESVTRPAASPPPLSTRRYASLLPANAPGSVTTPAASPPPATTEPAPSRSPAQTPSSAPPDAPSEATTPPPLSRVHQPEVRLLFEAGHYLSPDEMRSSILRPAGVSAALAIVALSPRESKACFRTWTEAYQILTYFTAEVSRSLGVRCRPPSVEGVALTRTQMARLAQNEGAPHPLQLRTASPRASLARGT